MSETTREHFGSSFAHSGGKDMQMQRPRAAYMMLRWGRWVALQHADMLLQHFPRGMCKQKVQYSFPEKLRRFLYVAYCWPELLHFLGGKMQRWGCVGCAVSHNDRQFSGKKK